MKNTEELKEHLYSLKKLLDDPHPGLSTWAKFYSDEMQWISDFWNAPEPSEPEFKLCAHESVTRLPGVTSTGVKISTCNACGSQLEEDQS